MICCKESLLKKTQSWLSNLLLSGGVYGMNVMQGGWAHLLCQWRKFIKMLWRVKEFHLVQEEPRNQITVPHPTHWLPPLPSVYKVNFDGATFLDITAAGLVWLYVTQRAWSLQRYRNESIYLQLWQPWKHWLAGGPSYLQLSLGFRMWFSKAVQRLSLNSSLQSSLACQHLGTLLRTHVP